MSFEEELERLRATPPEVVHTEVQLLVQAENEQVGPLAPDKACLLEIYLKDPEDSLKRLVDTLHSANHDERQFENPDEFLIDRNPNPHVGFGKGIHFCLGAPLARLESRIALGVLLRRFSRLRVDPEQPLEEHADPGFTVCKGRTFWSSLPKRRRYTMDRKALRRHRTSA